jgi:hypothetical protein
MWKKLPDNFFFGMLFGTISLFLSYLLVRGVRYGLVSYFENEFILEAPRVQLFAILINVIIFRLTMINFDREKTGKGILFSTVIMAFAYFILHSKYNYKMP